MNTNVSTVTLPGKGNYAIIAPGLLLFGLGASKQELEKLVEEASSSETEQSESTDEEFSAIGLIPTFDCNLRCIYCYSRGGESVEVMSMETAKAAIRYLKNSECHDILKIHLVGGGEPLYYKQWVFEISEYAKTLFGSVEFHIVSNGTFNEDVLRWIYRNNCTVRISYDGVMHEFQRPLATGESSKELVCNNIRALVAHQVPVMVQCIVTTPGLDTLVETIDEAVSLGVDVIKFEAARSTDVSRFIEGIEPDPVVYAEALLNAIVYVGNTYPNVMIDTGYFSEPSESNYCGMCGSNKMLTPHGLITACLEVSRPTDPYSDKLIFGSVEEGGAVILNQQKLDYLTQLGYTKEIGGCAECNLRLICHGGCPMEGIWEHGFPLRKSGYTCKLEHVFLPKLFLLLAESPELAKVLVNDAEISC